MSETAEKKAGGRSNFGPDYDGPGARGKGRGRGRGRGQGKVKQQRPFRPGGHILTSTATNTRNYFPEKTSRTQDQYQESEDHCKVNESAGPISPDLPKRDIEAQSQDCASTPGYSADKIQHAQLPSLGAQDQATKLGGKQV